MTDIISIMNSADEKRTKITTDPYRLGYHLMPPVGWLNDPNGLCEKDGTYHMYYQYSPQNVNGGNKAWGHYSTEDFVHYTRHAIAVHPDSPYDKDGAYSGCAIVKDDLIHYFYTGNVKEEGDHDYIHSGRQHNVIHMTSKDGIHFSEKQLIFRNSDYPADLTCHVRDPKVTKILDSYYMVLGARTNDDHGCVLIYVSEDLEHFTYAGRYETDENFGFMWECPDLFRLEDQLILMISPQGLQEEEYRFQNIYNNGYFTIGNSSPASGTVSNFTEFDIGFDFYAPQSFEDENGRRIVIGWMGLPDVDYTIPTTEYNWQHALTLPRRLDYCNGKLRQTVINEILSLRKEKIEVSSSESFKAINNRFELLADVTKQNFSLHLRNDVTIDYSNGIFSLSLKDSGYGRTKRSLKLDELRNIRIFSDTSSLEIFMNDGEYSITSRVFDDDTTILADEDLTIYMYGLFEIIDE